MIEINLLPHEFRRKDKSEKISAKMPDLPYLGIIAGIFLVLTIIEALLFAMTAYAGRRVSGMEVEFKRLTPDFERIKSVKLNTLRNDSLAEKLDELFSRPIFWTSLLNAVSDSLTENVWLTQVRSERKVIVFDLPERRSNNPRASATSAPVVEGKKASVPRVPRVPRKSKKTGKRVEHRLIIRGSTPVSGQGTASVGRFIQSLKDNAFMKTVLQDAKLEMIDQAEGKNSQSPTFDFTVVCTLSAPCSDAVDPV